MDVVTEKEHFGLNSIDNDCENIMTSFSMFFLWSCENVIINSISTS